MKATKIRSALLEDPRQSKSAYSAPLVVMLEFQEEGEAYLEWCAMNGADPSSAQVIALDPKIRLWLFQNNVQCVDSLPYFTTASHARSLIKSDELLTWLESQINLEDDLGISAAYSNALLWYSRYVLHELIWTVEVLNEVTRQHPHATIMAFISSQNAAAPMIQPQERFLGSIAERYCEENDLPFMPLAGRSSERRQTTSKSKIGSSLRLPYLIAGSLHRAALRRIGRQRPILSLSHGFKLDTLLSQAKLTGPELPSVAFAEISRSEKPTTLLRRTFKLMFTDFRNGRDALHLGEVWPALLQRSCSEDKDFKSRIDQLISDLANQAEKDRQQFSHMGIFFGTEYASKLRSGIAPSIHRLHREVRSHDQILKLLSPRLVLAPFGRRSIHALGELCSRRGIPGLLISHASFTPTKNNLEEIEWGFHGMGLFHGSFSHAALQTPMAAQFAKQRNVKAQFVATGPLSWGWQVDQSAAAKLKKSLLSGRENDRVVVHAGTPHGRGSIHFHVYETMDEYVSALADLVMAVDQIPNTYLIIKAKREPLSPRDLISLLPKSDNFCVSVDEPFLDVLGISNLLVSMASTTIEEALQNRVPVLMYGGDGRYQHISSQNVFPGDSVPPRAAYAVNSAANLPGALSEILDTICAAPINAHLFDPYIYKPEEMTPFGDLVRLLASNMAKHSKSEEDRRSERVPN